MVKTMETKDYLYFIKLVECRSYIKTAQFFGITQPAISAMVKRLEKGIGTKLFIKRGSNSSLHITNAGKVVYRAAKELVRIETAMKVDAKRASKNQFKLAYSELAGSLLLPAIITKLNQGNLLANVETYQENSHLLEGHILEGKYDAIIFSRLTDEYIKGIKSVVLQKHEYQLIVPASSELAKKSEIDLFTIGTIPLIMRHKRFLSRTALDRIFAKINFHPQKRLIVDSIDATLELVRNNMGVAYLMNSTVKNIPGVVAVPLVPSQKQYVYQCLGIRENAIPNEFQKACLEIIQEIKS